MNRNIALENDQVESLEDWQAKAERLEELVCALLAKNRKRSKFPSGAFLTEV